MNKVILSGRITKDIELRYTTNNCAVTNFNLAVRRNKDEADFVSIVAYSKTAELIQNYCKKGSSINIVGRLQTRQYDDKDGKRVYVTEVIVDEIEFLDKKEQKEETKITEAELPF